MNGVDNVKQALFKDVDCVHLHTSNLEEGLGFYCGALGMKMLWRTDVACGLGTENGTTEIVLALDEIDPIVDIKVENVEEALPVLIGAGATVEAGPFDLDIGRGAVIVDPWGNRYCILDTTKGTYDTDDNGTVKGVSNT